MEWHTKYLSPNTKQCVSIFVIAFISGAHAYCDTEIKAFKIYIQLYNFIIFLAAAFL